MSQQTLHIDSLIEGCIQGNERAQLEIYNRYYKAMYNTSLRIVKDPMEAEDIMQESFLKAFTKLNSFRGEVSFGSWLKKIVVNNSIYHYRKNKKNREVALDDVLYKVEDTGLVSDENGQYEEKARKILEAMNGLKENYRISLTLHLIEGYDYEEIGSIMDMSYANCRTTISRAKESLRKKMINAI